MKEDYIKIVSVQTPRNAAPQTLELRQEAKNQHLETKAMTQLKLWKSIRLSATTPSKMIEEQAMQHANLWIHEI